MKNSINPKFSKKRDASNSRFVIQIISVNGFFNPDIIKEINPYNPEI